jgi:hypothetical protein
MTTYSEFSFDSGNERARLISLEHVVITRSTYLKCGVVWKMSDWADLAEASGDYVMIADTFHPHPLDPPIHLSKYVHKHTKQIIYPPLPPSPESEPELVTYDPGTSLYWTVDKDNYSIAVVRKDGVFQVKRCDNAVVLSTQNGLKIITKRTFFPSVAAWTETLQDGGKLTISLPKKRDIICMAPRHYGYCKYI